MSFNPGNRQQVNTRWTKLSPHLGARESMETRYEASPEDFDRQGDSVSKQSQIEEGASEEISEVGQNGNSSIYTIKRFFKMEFINSEIELKFPIKKK